MASSTLLTRLRRATVAGRQRALATVRAARERWGWFDHAARGYERYTEVQGDRLAAAVTFFGFLSFFPLVALAFAVTGYAVVISPDFREYLVRGVDSLLPGLASELPVQQIAQARGSAGAIGLVGLVLSGLGSVDALRGALRTVWRVDPGGGGGLVVKKLWDAVVLVVLGTTLIGSVAVSTVATSATHGVLGLIGLEGVTGAGMLLRSLSIAVAVLANTVIFLVLFSRLSGTHAPCRSLLRGAVFGAVGLEALKLVGTLLVGQTTSNPIYASFAVMVGLLVWINLAARFTVFAACWTATRSAILRADTGHLEVSPP